MSDQTTLHLYFLALAIGLLAPLFRGRRGTVLGVCAGFAIVLMGYFYAIFWNDRLMALYLGGCEAAVLALVLLARWRKLFFWLAWALHALLVIACATIIIWVQYFFHPAF